MKSLRVGFTSESNTCIIWHAESTTPSVMCMHVCDLHACAWVEGGEWREGGIFWHAVFLCAFAPPPWLLS